ncbi:MAG TPA: hypothetical protein VLL98_01385 [Rickettsiales bacterium]|nr:hypothetical protein [Rickettsiales bacterium]
MKLNNLTFEEAMKQLESKIEQLEKDDNVNNQQLFEEAMELKDYCSELLKKEKEEIIKVAKENNIPLSEIGLEENENSNEDEEDEEDEDEEDNENNENGVR